MQVSLLLAAVLAVATASDVCSQPKKTGPCRAMMPRFYFNGETGKCEPFVYGGCLGNKNNFINIEHCRSECESSGNDFCKLEPDTGPCRAAFPKFYYNPATGKCDHFYYGGCDGNANRFDDEQSCMNTCAASRSARQVDDTCSLPAETGPCRAYFRRFFFNSQSGRCERFVYGGCAGNQNNFETVGECNRRCSRAPRDTDVCSQPKVVGPCRAAFPRFFFNQQSGQCERFIYGGCRGNDNNFNSAEECQTACPSRSSRNIAICEQPRKVGPCRALIPRFYFNKESGSCQQFGYGGCDGNENNFESQQDCEKACK